MVETVITGLNLTHQAMYYVHVRTTNTIGRQSITTAPTRVFVDQTPPIPVIVHPHNGASIAIEYTQEWLPLSATVPSYSATWWQAGACWEFVDAESEMARYDVRILDAVGDPTTPLASAIVGPDAACTIFNDLRMSHLSKYQVYVRAQSIANLFTESVSNIVTIDLTRPHVRQALDLAGNPSAGPLAGDRWHATTQQPELVSPVEQLNMEIDFVPALSQLHVGFGVWDEESGVDTVLVACGIAPGATSVLPWTAVPTNGRRVVAVPLPDDVAILPHVRYYVAVAAVNGAGALSLWTSTDGVMVDDTGPVCVQRRIRDGRHRLLDIDFQAGQDKVVAQWRSGIFDLESFVHHFEATLVDTDTGNIVAGPVNTGVSTRVTFTGLQLSHTQRVATVVKSVNRAGTYTECSTDGLMVDLTGPLPVSALPQDVVSDGNTANHGFDGDDIEFTASTEAAFVSWADIHDPESGLNNVWVWAEAVDGIPLTDRQWVHPSLNEWTLSVPLQPQGAAYRVVVRAVNRASSAEVYRSDGVQIDTTPPVFTSSVDLAVSPGGLGLEPHVVASATATISVVATVQDAESGIQRCRAGVGTYPDGSDVTGVVTANVDELPNHAVEVVTSQRGGQTVCDPYTVSHDCITVPVSELTTATTVRIDLVVNAGVSLPGGNNLFGWLVCTNGYAG